MKSKKWESRGMEGEVEGNRQEEGWEGGGQGMVKRKQG